MPALSPEQEEAILQLRERMRKRGYSFRKFAKEKGYPPYAVTVAVRRFLVQGVKPKGLTQRKILRDIRHLLRQPIKSHPNGAEPHPPEESL